MNKAFLKKTVSAIIVVATITTLSPLGVSAHWRQNIDSTWNYTEGNNIVQGWKKISDTWYYFNLNGKMNTGWICDEGIWYYNNSSGAMQTGWFRDNGTWYYLDNSGAMRIGWIKDNGKWYYTDNAGAMKVGWIKDNDKFYYADNTGVIETGSVNISEERDYFKKLYELQKDNSVNQTTTLTKPENNTSTTDATVDINGLPELPHNYSTNVQASAENEILQLMNQKRSEAGLQPLTMDNTLLQVARYKSNHMIQYNYFDHTTPQGEKWTTWLKAIDYKYTATGENIAYNTYNAVELFNQWWNSSGHRANMMNASYTKVGVGVINGNGKYMGTQEFSN